MGEEKPNRLDINRLVVQSSADNSVNAKRLQEQMDREEEIQTKFEFLLQTLNEVLAKELNTFKQQFEGVVMDDGQKVVALERPTEDWGYIEKRLPNDHNHKSRKNFIYQYEVQCNGAIEEQNKTIKAEILDDLSENNILVLVWFEHNHSQMPLVKIPYRKMGALGRKERALSDEEIEAAANRVREYFHKVVAKEQGRLGLGFWVRKMAAFFRDKNQ